MSHIGGIKTYPNNTSKKLSGWTKNTAGDTILPATIPQTTTLSLPLTSISKHSSGELLGNSQITEDLQLNDQHPLNWDSESTMKRELTEVIGVHWTEKKTKKRNHLEAHSNLEVTMTKPQKKTSTFLPLTQQQQLKNNLNNWLATFQLTSPLPESSLPSTIKLQCQLLQWPQSQQLPLSLQQRYWAEILDLQYPLTPSEVDHHHQALLEEEEEELAKWRCSFGRRTPRTSWRRGKSQRTWRRGKSGGGKLVGHKPEVFDGM
jgi:hypothetical protein